MSEITATKEQQNKYEALKEYLRSLESVAVAFSSGVDSTFLLKTAHDVLGDKCIAITAMSCSFPKRELEEAKAFCEKEGIRHITVESEELEIEGFCQNPANRCYICKKENCIKRISAPCPKTLAFPPGRNSPSPVFLPVLCTARPSRRRNLAW